MRIATYAVVAVLALLIGVGAGYLRWGQQAADLTRQVEQQRSEYEFRISEQERRARAAEERARQETEARKVLEEELHKIRPLK